MMEEKQFAELVNQAVNRLPHEFINKLSNVDVVIQDFPTRYQMRKAKCKRGIILLGLYEGVPLTARSQYYNMVLPDKITIFKNPIEEVCKTEAEIITEVQQVIIHEIAHHFGISDARLDQIGHHKDN